MGYLHKNNNELRVSLVFYMAAIINSHKLQNHLSLIFNGIHDLAIADFQFRFAPI